MSYIKLQYYKNGVDVQKKSDITIDLKRPIMDKWTIQQKKNLPEFIRGCENAFKLWINELKKQ